MVDGDTVRCRRADEARKAYPRGGRRCSCRNPLKRRRGERDAGAGAKRAQPAGKEREPLQTRPTGRALSPLPPVPVAPPGRGRPADLNPVRRYQQPSESCNPSTRIRWPEWIDQKGQAHRGPARPRIPPPWIVRVRLPPKSTEAAARSDRPSVTLRIPARRIRRPQGPRHRRDRTPLGRQPCAAAAVDTGRVEFAFSAAVRSHPVTQPDERHAARPGRRRPVRATGYPRDGPAARGITRLPRGLQRDSPAAAPQGRGCPAHH